MSNLMKIRPVGVELFHADRRIDKQTDKTKIIVSFANTPKDSQVISNWKTKINQQNAQINSGLIYY